MATWKHSHRVVAFFAIKLDACVTSFCFVYLGGYQTAHKPFNPHFEGSSYTSLMGSSGEPIEVIS